MAGGQTLDYGPFGFVERFVESCKQVPRLSCCECRYSSKFALWVGSGEHYGFLNQTTAAYANFGSFTFSLWPLLDKDARSEVTLIDHRSQMLLSVWCW